MPERWENRAALKFLGRLLRLSSCGPRLHRLSLKAVLYPCSVGRNVPDPRFFGTQRATDAQAGSITFRTIQACLPT